MSPTLILLLLGLARAGDVFVVDEVSRTPADAEEVLTFSRLRLEPPRVLDAGAVAGCTTPGDVAALAKAAEGELLYMADASAARYADQALAALRCLDVPAEPEQLGRVAMVRGIAASYLNDDADAHRWFAWARSTGVSWDPSLGEQGHVQFDAALSAAAATLRWVAPGAQDVLIDGRPPAPVGPGPHLLQLRGPDGWQSLLVEVEAPTTTVVVPGVLDPAMIDFDDPSDLADLSTLIAATVGPGRSIRVLFGDIAVRGTSGEPRWKRDRADVVRPLLVGVGGALAAVGGVMVAVAIDKAGAADAARCEATTLAGWEAADGAHARAARLYTAGWAAAGSGIALAGTALIVGIAASPTSATLRVQVRR